MSRYEASFEVESPADLSAVRRIFDQAYDAVREESRTLGEDAEDATALLESFETLRAATERPSAGKLTISYERYDDRFDN
ncbi:hypothetical protein [Halogeometricum limi]|uniref:Uncharacterized protein n=1 Tax=Halogeometricum limi TaxID=555875 RepID=A0A1I6HF57_9EURY|nr:hypothetical protein [Halogeometricum limi]SFR53113.1 hypothetical protein SAMN04488124_2170 [Halogeometricum limi]